MATDIIVTGRYSAGVPTFHNYNFTQSGEPANSPSYDTTAPQNPATGDVSVNVNVSIDNPANQAKAIEAANNVADAVARIITAASKLPAGTVIPLPNGNSITAGTLLYDLQRTKFVITDRPTTNSGVGSANRVTMTDTLHFASFAEGTGISGYTAPGYNGTGVIGIIMHEMSHMTSHGYNNYLDSVRYFNRENAERKLKNVPFYGSEYGNANEMFAHLGSLSMAGALQLDVSTYKVLMEGGVFKDQSYRAPVNVYNDRKAENE
ncbi:MULTISPECIES: hypothetical protein [unclassified Sphingomonas]|uniref:hypothetical protein n=1 Tax=unclassified Sphingomonas TaxID=196159 RepID=UPI0012E1CF8B|nr:MULTISPECIES: hypothetical protein [unclassified Sphingomonas]